MGRESNEKDNKSPDANSVDTAEWELPHGEDSGVSIQVGFGDEPDNDEDAQPPEPPADDSEVPPPRVSMQVVAEDGLNAAIESIMPQMAYDIEAMDEAKRGGPDETATTKSGPPVGARPKGFDSSEVETDEFSDLCDEAEALSNEGCFDQAFQILEMLGQRLTDHPYLKDLQSACEYRALEFYEKELSPTSRILRVAIDPKEIMSQKLNQESAFVLSRIDGSASVDDLIDVTGLTKFKTLRILFKLVDAGIVAVD